jgi:hypothetical protein
MVMEQLVPIATGLTQLFVCVKSSEGVMDEIVSGAVPLLDSVNDRGRLGVPTRLEPN